MYTSITVFITLLNVAVMFGFFKESIHALRPLRSQKFSTKKARVSDLLGMSSQSPMSPVRVRFAPSPTGSLHVGGARTALFNWLLAKKSGGKFLIRVEDTDEARSTRASETSILNDLKWLNMTWDEGPEIGGPHAPYRQSERKEIYKEAAEKLISEGYAYRCFCTEEELESKRLASEEAAAASSDPNTAVGGYDGTWRDADPAEVKLRLERGDPYTVRFRVPPGKVVTIDDKVRGRVTWETDAALLGDFIILRSNGMPVYNFCVSVDDAYMRITHVVRAEEHLSNTLRQMLILEALHVVPPIYAHCSLILGSDRSKLSKRHGATSVQQFSQQGYLPEAMVNYLANLGWNDGTDKEIYTPEELCRAFDLNRIVKSAAVFDLDKLRWINAQHLRAKTPEQLQPVVLQALCAGDHPILPASYLPSACASAISDHSHDIDSSSIDSVAVPVAVAVVLSAEQQAQFGQFMKYATVIAQRDMELTVDVAPLVHNCLQFNLSHTLLHDPHVLEVLQAPALPALISALLRDYDSGTMPRGTEEGFAELWKAYLKGLGKELGLKGKGLFHPVRLCITGRMSGPDVGDQMQLIVYSEGLLHPQYAATAALSVRQRMDFLRTFSIPEALAVAQQAQAQAQAQARALAPPAAVAVAPV